MRIRYHLSRFFLFKGKRTNLWFFVSNACLCTSRTHPKERVSEAVTARSPGSCWVCLHGGWLAAFLPPGRVGPPGQAVSGFDRKRPRVREIYLCIYKRTRFAFSIWVLQYAVLHTTCEKSKKLAYMFHWPPDTRETLTSLATTTPSRDEPMAWTCFEHAQILYTDTHVSQAMSLVYLFSPLYFSFFSIFSFFLFENYSDRLGKVSENPGFSQHSIPDPCLPYKHMVGGGLWGTGVGGAGVTSLGRRVEGQGTLKLMNGIGIEFKFGSFVFKLKKKKKFSDEKLLQDYTEVYFEEEVRLLCINIAQACKIQRNTWVWNSLRDSNNFFCSLSFMSLSLKKKQNMNESWALWTWNRGTPFDPVNFLDL